MRIAIIGAGLFGCVSAIKLSQVSAIKLSQEGFDVVLYDKSSPLKKAIVNNQHRIHLGFHYPRSLETIAECKRGYESFMKDHRRVQAGLRKLYERIWRLCRIF